VKIEGLRIDLEGGTPHGDTLQFTPGQRLAGRVTLQADRDLTVKAVTVLVQWKTSGKGNVDIGVAWTNTWPVEPAEQALQPGRALSRPFECTLPVEPWSYAGQIVSIEWEVRAVLDVPWAVDPAVSRPFRLHP